MLIRLYEHDLPNIRHNEYKTAWPIALCWQNVYTGNSFFSSFHIFGNLCLRERFHHIRIAMEKKKKENYTQQIEFYWHTSGSNDIEYRENFHHEFSLSSIVALMPSATM